MCVQMIPIVSAVVSSVVPAVVSTAAITTATATAVTTATAAAVTSASTSTSATVVARRARAGNVSLHNTTVHLLAVHRRCGVFCILLLFVGHKRETARIHTRGGELCGVFQLGGKSRNTQKTSYVACSAKALTHADGQTARQLAGKRP